MSDDIVEQTNGLSLNGDHKHRTLMERLTDATPDPSLASTLQECLSNKAECLMYLSHPGNLDTHDWMQLFDPPDPTCTKDEGWDVTADQSNAIIQSIRNAVDEIDARIGVLYDPLSSTSKERPAERNDDETNAKWTAKGMRLLLRRLPEGPAEITEIRIATCGNVDAGKSTLLGVLTKGRLDDGRGRARIALMRHKHEIETGRTSSVGLELLGFDAASKEVVPEGFGTGINGAPEAGLRRQQLSWDEISQRAAKIISFIDLAGHEKYLKTTISGMTGHAPDFVMLVIGSNAGLIGMSKEHLSVALSLAIPVICVITKTDMTPPLIQAQTLKQLTKILRSPGCRKAPVFVHDNGMAIELARTFSAKGQRIAPIFEISNVSGIGLEHLRCFLNVLPASTSDVDKRFELPISEIFSVPFVGCVVSGVILTGKTKVGDPVLLGPNSLGGWIKTNVKSIQRKRATVTHAEAGQSVSFSLKRVRREDVRKGMILIGAEGPTPRSVMRFQASVLILYHNTTIQSKYQSMLHVSSVRQTVRIVEILDKSVLRTGDKADVIMEFLSVPEAIKEGQRILFREGKTKGLGLITKLL